MDNNNKRPVQVEPDMDANHWRTQLSPDSRLRIVNKIMETLKRQLPISGPEGLQELKKIAVRFEEKIYTAATSQSDYLRKIALKILRMESKYQNTVVTGSLPSDSAGSNQNPVDPGSHNMQHPECNQGQSLPIPLANQSQQQLLTQSILNPTAFTGVQNSANLPSHNALPQPPKSENIERLKMFKTMLERMITFLQAQEACLYTTARIAAPSASLRSSAPHAAADTISNSLPENL